MIREAAKEDLAQICPFIRQDNARNYFIRLGMESPRPVFERIVGEWDAEGDLKAVLFERLSGNLQFYAREGFDAAGFGAELARLEFDSLISPVSCCSKLAFAAGLQRVKTGAVIAKLDKSHRVASVDKNCSWEYLRIEDLDQVTALYKRVFDSFSSKQVMEERLKGQRGRGLCLKRDGHIISVLQSEFEEKDSALIVGVATAPEEQGRGLATEGLKLLCEELQQEGKDLFLLYDNPTAGKIYEKIGFCPIDEVGYYKKG